jgi:RNA polymerase sigma-70 factor, ECF subfamily
MDSDDRVLREEMLRREVLAGDEQAWRQWYGETFEDLYRYALWRCGNRRDWADEIVQETWLTAVRSLRRFAPRQGSFLAWLRGIASNVLRNHFRRQAKHRELQQYAASTASTSSEADAFRSIDNRQEHIATVLDAMSDRHEAVLRAKYFDGLTVEQIANNWDTTPKAVESLLTRAREAFREMYEKMK